MHHELTEPRTPQQNGIAEQANCTVAEATWAILQYAGMLAGFWEFTISTAVHVWNWALDCQELIWRGVFKEKYCKSVQYPRKKLANKVKQM